MKSKKELSPNAIYDYAVYLQEKGELTNKKRDILFDMLIECSIKNKDTTYIYKFLKKIPGISFDKLVDTAIVLGNEKIICDLITIAKGNQKEKLINALIKLSIVNEKENKEMNPEMIYKYMISLKNKGELKGNEIDILLNILIESSIKNKDGNYIYEMAKEVKEIPIDKLEDVAIAIGDPKVLYDFIMFIKESNKEKLIDALIKIKSGMYLYYLALFMDNPPMKKLEEGIIESGDPLYMYYFALDNDITGANVEKLVDKILMCNNNVEILGKCMLLPINIKQKIEISTKITKLLEDNIDNNKKKVK